MNQERFNELAALNAAGALDGDDLREFQESLARADAATKSEMARLNNLAGYIGVSRSSGASLPPGLKAKVMKQIQARAQARRERALPYFFSIRSAEGQWTQLPVPGVRCKELSAGSKNYKVTLYELAPGTRFPSHHHSGPEECFVLSGYFHVQGSILHAGDFHHADPNSDHEESFTVAGCQLLVVAANADYK